MIPLLLLQLIGLGPFMAAWDAYPSPDAVTLRLYLDGEPYSTLPGAATTEAVKLPTIGAHELAISAVALTDGRESVPKTIFAFATVQAVDPCAPPLGAHAPAVFPTSPTVTTGKPGSRSFMNYQLGGPDAVTEVGLLVDGVEVATGTGTDLKAFSGIWFTQPAAGSHMTSVRVKTAFGCVLVRNGPMLVVK